MSLIGLLGFRVRERRVARGVVCACTLALLATASSFAGERELEDAPPPTSIEEIEGSLEQAYPEPEVRPSLFPWVRRQVQRLPRFLEDSQLQLRYRTYYLRQDFTYGPPGCRVDEVSRINVRLWVQPLLEHRNVSRLANLLEFAYVMTTSRYTEECAEY